LPVASGDRDVVVEELVPLPVGDGLAKVATSAAKSAAMMWTRASASRASGSRIRECQLCLTL
jgi:hypothetical protein